MAEIFNFLTFEKLKKEEEIRKNWIWKLKKKQNRLITLFLTITIF